MTEPRALPENRALDTLAAAQAVSSALLSLLLEKQREVGILRAVGLTEGRFEGDETKVIENG